MDGLCTEALFIIIIVMIKKSKEKDCLLTLVVWQTKCQKRCIRITLSTRAKKEVDWMRIIPWKKLFICITRIACVKWGAGRLDEVRWRKRKEIRWYASHLICRDRMVHTHLEKSLLFYYFSFLFCILYAHFFQNIFSVWIHDSLSCIFGVPPEELFMMMIRKERRWWW